MNGYKTMTKKETEKRDAIEYLKKQIMADTHISF